MSMNIYKKERTMNKKQKRALVQSRKKKGRRIGDTQRERERERET